MRDENVCKRCKVYKKCREGRIAPDELDLPPDERNVFLFEEEYGVVAESVGCLVVCEECEGQPITE